MFSFWFQPYTLGHVLEITLLSELKWGVKVELQQDRRKHRGMLHNKKFNRGSVCYQDKTSQIDVERKRDPLVGDVSLGWQQVKCCRPRLRLPNAPLGSETENYPFSFLFTCLIKEFCALLGGSYKSKLSESYDRNCMKRCSVGCFSGGLFCCQNIPIFNSKYVKKFLLWVL